MDGGVVTQRPRQGSYGLQTGRGCGGKRNKDEVRGYEGGYHGWSRLVYRRRDRVRLRYGVGGPARLSASDCCGGS